MTPTMPVLTPEQLAEYEIETRANALTANHPASWLWSEADVTWAAPTPPPTDGLPYVWDEPSVAWVHFPDYPY